MAFESIKKELTGDSPGQYYALNYYRLGDQNVGKKVFLQAALHADEEPGILILHHLLNLLKAADARHELHAEFVVFPMVNPLGMSHLAFQSHQGRYNPITGVNYNRQWPDFFTALGRDLAGRLGHDVALNQAIIQQTLQQCLDKMPAVTALQQQRKWVMREAYDADYVLDLHCDREALVHIFSVPQLNEVVTQLGLCINAAAILTAEDSGGGSFDEVWPSLYLQLARAFPDKAIPPPPVSATLEFRGAYDVFDDINLQDAEGLYRFFQQQGLIGGEVITQATIPLSQMTQPTPLNATDMTRVEHAGLLAYQVALGDWVKQGQVIAELLILEGDDAFQQRIPVVAGTSGRVISRNVHKYVWPGCSIAKIVGTEPLPQRGEYLLED